MRMLAVLFLSLLPLAGLASAEEADETEGPRRIGLVRVRADGPCRIPLARLRRLGLEDPYRLAVRRDGEPVRVYTAEEIDLDADHVAFLARDTARPASAFAVYELWRLPSRRARAPLDGHGASVVPLPRVLDQGRFHGALGAADPGVYDPGDTPRPHWFLAVVPRGRRVTVPLGPMGAKPGTEQVLEARVYGAWRDLATLHATWNGRPLATVATPDPSAQHVVRWVVPPALVPGDTAPLVIHNTSPTPSAPPRHDVSEHRGTLYLSSLTLLGPGARAAPWRGSRLVEVEQAGMPADPLAAAGAATHVILATPPLLAGARRLAAHRTRTGTPSAVVPVVDVYDRYGHGEAGGEAIARFVADLQQREDAPLRYLVLAGDATYDRTDIVTDVTIPARMAYTMYNGATPSDALYAGAGDTAVGRLPFAHGAEIDAFVTRVIRYETEPPATPTRRMLRFVTSPGRFGAFIDGIIESRFRNVLRHRIPPAYDVAITYANPDSPYMWPVQSFDAHVVEQLNAGALFFTYVGHGFEHGFDTVRVGDTRHPILHVGHADRVDIETMPPVVFVLACTTGMFDGLRGPGIGEALMRRPRGPIAYVGATRVCHPGYNALFGESVAEHMGLQTPQPRLADLLAAAKDHAADPSNRQVVRMAITTLAGNDSARLAREGAAMYGLLGDPALRLPLPETTPAIETGRSEDGRTLEVLVRGRFEPGARVEASLEQPRTREPVLPHPDADPANPADAGKVRANHAAANDLRITAARAEASEAGLARLRLDLPPAGIPPGALLKVFVRDGGRVAYGAVVLP